MKLFNGSNSNWIVLTAVMALCLALPMGATADKAPKMVKLGLMFGLTGAASPVGPVQLDGAKLAIDEINAAGGIK
ncbi:MAG: transporter substrate-binding protein, partial [bacterium]|nr:transporter substrate-binding protein [bacterium]